MPCNENNVKLRGANNAAQAAYADTVADYSSSSTPIGDNSKTGLTCDASVSIGSVVRVNAGTIVNALANNLANSKAIGICIAKASSTECTVLFTGPTGNIYSSLDDTKPYFLSTSTPGAITTTVPTTGYVIKIGYTITGSDLALQIERVVKKS